MKKWRLLILASLIAGSASGTDYQFKNGESVIVRPDQAYLLVRTSLTIDARLRGKNRFSPILIRELSDEELARVRPVFDKDPFNVRADLEPNVVQPNAKQPFAEANATEFMVVAVKPGIYVLAGVSVTNWELKDAGIAIACLCMGTVKFFAEPGVVTDLGDIVLSRDDHPAGAPPPTQVASSKPWGFGTAPPIVAVRPATADTSLPDGLTRIRIVPAAYSAVGDMPNYIGAPVTRLSPVPGVLSYDEKGQVARSTGAGSNPHRDEQAFH